MGVPTWAWILVICDVVGILIPLVILLVVLRRKRKPVVDLKARWEIERAVRINLLEQVIMAEDASDVLIYGSTPLTSEQVQEMAERQVDAELNNLTKMMTNGGA